MLTGRPILGLVHHNDELDSMLLRSGNFSVPADQVEAIADAVEHIIAMFKNNSLSEWPICQDWTVLQAVDQLLQFGDEAKSQIR